MLIHFVQIILKTKKRAGVAITSRGSMGNQSEIWKKLKKDKCNPSAVWGWHGTSDISKALSYTCTALYLSNTKKKKKTTGIWFNLNLKSNSTTTKSVSENLVSYLHFKALKAVPSKSCICTYDAQKLAAYGFDTQPWRDSSSKNVKSVIIYTPSRHSKPVRLERCQSQSPFTFIFHTAKVTKAVSH